MRNSKKKMSKKKIPILATPKQIQFLKFLNEDFKFGKCEIIIHASDPQKVIIKEIEKIFDGNVEKPLDTSS